MAELPRRPDQVHLSIEGRLTTYSGSLWGNRGPYHSRLGSLRSRRIGPRPRLGLMSALEIVLIAFGAVLSLGVALVVWNVLITYMRNLRREGRLPPTRVWILGAVIGALSAFGFAYLGRR
jgi:hypothetical protein